MFLLRNNSKLCKYVVCILQFGCSNLYTKNAPKLAILSSKIENFSGGGGTASSTLPPVGRGTPPPHAPPPRCSALQCLHLQRSTLWPANPKRLDSTVLAESSGNNICVDFLYNIQNITVP